MVYGKMDHSYQKFALSHWIALHCDNGANFLDSVVPNCPINQQLLEFVHLDITTSRVICTKIGENWSSIYIPVD